MVYFDGSGMRHRYFYITYITVIFNLWLFLTFVRMGQNTYIDEKHHLKLGISMFNKRKEGWAFAAKTRA